VILVLPKCLLTWGYVEVDAAAFCLQHDDRHGESAGPGERDKPWEAPCPGPSVRSARMGAMPDTMQPAPLPSVYQLRVVVRGVSPLIWRRLLILADTTIADLHAVLQVAFGWTGTHLHRFVVQGREYGIG
jgi:hypothetical protein